MGEDLFSKQVSQILKTDSAPWNWFGEVETIVLILHHTAFWGGICQVSFVYPVLYKNELCFYFAKVLKV